jgi:hypothetical protein
VTLYRGAGCHLCEPALATLQQVRTELGFELEVVAIDGDPVLERRYRAYLPVVEIDGRRAFTYVVPADELRALLA